MRIGIQTWGSDGDVRPLLALTQGLARAGHELHLVYADVSATTTPAEVARCGAASVQSLVLDRDGQRFREAGRELLFKRASPVQQIADVLERLLYPLEAPLAETAAALCARCDLVVGHFLLYPLAAAAARAGTPRVAVFTAPAYPSRHYVPAGVPDLGPLGNRVLWWLGGSALEKIFGGAPRAHYRARGLPPPGALTDEVWGSSLLNLVSASPALFEPPDDWPAHHRVCGHLAPVDDAADRPPPAELVRFFAAGEAPVYVTFGSMNAAEVEPGPLLARIVEAVRRAGCRAIVQADWSQAVGVPEHPRVFRIARAPHAALFARCAAIVHHGGAGTTHTAARAGRPQLVVTHATDQRFWASLLRRRGLSRATLRRQTLTAQALARALRDTLDDVELGRRAAELGARMRLEDGVATAVAWIAQAVPARR